LGEADDHRRVFETGAANHAQRENHQRAETTVAQHPVSADSARNPPTRMADETPFREALAEVIVDVRFGHCRALFDDDAGQRSDRGPQGTAACLGLRRTTLLYRMEKLGISRQPP
jgi:hypothetical protein